MADPDTDVDEQDQSEAFDEENTNLDDRDPEGEDAEQPEDLVDVYDSTSREGDADEDETQIGDDLDDDQIVASARDGDDDDDDLEDDDLVRGDQDTLHAEDGQDDISDVDDDDPDAVDGVDARQSDEVELEYVGDLNDLEGAASAAQSLEASALSDRDLRELDYKDEFTLDDKDPDAPASE
jgi:hypothetical protein